jgi:hypothetical protein
MEKETTLYSHLCSLHSIHVVCDNVKLKLENLHAGKTFEELERKVDGQVCFV